MSVGFGRMVNAMFENGSTYAGMGAAPLVAVVIDDEKEHVTFKFDGAPDVVFRVEGDCCSSSWIEHLDVPPDCIGEKLVSVEDGDGVPWDGHECVPKKADEDGYAYGNECDHDHLKVYNTKFVTAKGTVVLEYRNDSNGYYGGYLVRQS